MSATQFAQPILTGGLRLPSFFNGRLLSAEDLSQQQDTLQLAQHRLGMAVGAGVAFGLEVSELRREGGSGEVPRPILQVTKGLAVNLAGQPLWLERDVELPFLRPRDDTPAVGGSFQDCGQPNASAPVISGSDGAYILTIAPAEQPDGLAPVSGLGNRAAVCNHKELVQGVQFQLKLLFPAARFAGAGLKLRNRVAYACFGTPDFSRLDFTAPTQPPGQPGALDIERPGLLADCEVPLAVLYWTRDESLQFVDMWAVKRQVTGVVGTPAPLVGVGGPMRQEGEAKCRQFQDHLAWMQAKFANPGQTRIRDHMRFLPPLGVVPLLSSLQPRGFHPDLFFDGITLPPVVYLEGARLGQLALLAVRHPAQDLDGGILLWVYRVREIEQALVTPTGADPAQPCLVFSSGYLPFLGDPHFDVSRWNYSNWM